MAVSIIYEPNQNSNIPCSRSCKVSVTFYTKKKRINKSDLSFLQKLKKDIFSKVPLPLSGYVETHSDRGRGTGPLPLSGCVSTYPDRGRGLTLHA